MSVRINYSEFEILVGEILKSSPNVKLKKHDGRARPLRAPDLEFEFAKESWAAEVKFYRTARAQMSLLRDAVEQACQMAIRARAEKVMLVVSSELTVDQKKLLESAYPILVVDRALLRGWALKGTNGESARLDALLDGDVLESFDRSDPVAESVDIDTFLERAKSVTALSVPQFQVHKTGEVLAEELAKLSKGKPGWANYEVLCTRILKYLFDVNLNGWHQQKRSDDGGSRYDLVCRVSPKSEFWRFITESVGSSYVVFEFKNYEREISQGQILTTEKYLMERALRKVAIVLTRKGEDDGARKTRQGAMRESGKLLMVLDDSKIKEMLRARDNARDPSDLLFNWVDQFLMGLPR